MIDNVPGDAAVGHDDDHRRDLPLRERLDLAELDLAGFVVRVAVQQIDDGVAPLRDLVIVRKIAGVVHDPVEDGALHAQAFDDLALVHSLALRRRRRGEHGENTQDNHRSLSTPH